MEKKALTTAESVRVVEKHPWVITFPNHEDLTFLFDPLERKRYTLNLPELVGTDVCYSKDGWLLMRRSSLVDMFFFNPYTRELINLPKFDFDVASRTMSEQAWNEHRCAYMRNDNAEWFNLPKRIYLAEQKGELFLMYTCSSEIPMVYKLVSSNWEEINSTTLYGVTIFASMYSSETRLDVLGMRNSVYFPKYGLDCKGCVSYSFDEARYYPRKQFPKPTMWQMQKELCPLRSLWIEPPSKDILDVMK
ncbi:unnamed protein product [Arabidopsis thaliana]|uniref:KIB1-4 beta-propeller domain-containing protein n=1 Tax=Arabidopsis thaliana TaxID=3702 RepID=A0A5S9XR26_ARATH|nr:unnamed protein product [Arabidopsis thaliana]